MKIRNRGEKCFFSCLYRLPSQDQEELQSFYADFNLFLSNINNLRPACSIITSDLSPRSTNW